MYFKFVIHDGIAARNRVVGLTWCSHCSRESTDSVLDVLMVTAVVVVNVVVVKRLRPRHAYRQYSACAGNVAKTTRENQVHRHKLQRCLCLLTGSLGHQPCLLTLSTALVIEWAQLFRFPSR